MTRPQHAARRGHRALGAGLAAVLLAAVVAGAALWTAGAFGSSTGRPAAAGHRGHPTTTAPVPSTTSTTLPPPTAPPTTDPGLLPQTDALPSASDPQFQAEMAALWQGVVAGSATPALPAFFPETAYAQLKALADPDADWSGRLVADYGLDLAAAHALLGPDAGSAQLQTVDVPAAAAHWVPAGVCANRLGYYEVPNSRVVYEVDGQVHSFGIASMISWRGEWYVVHLGAVLRSGNSGVVDDPEAGPGTPAYSTTC